MTDDRCQLTSLSRLGIATLVALLSACQVDGQMSDQDSAVFSQGPSRVVDALTQVLVQRDALAAEVVPGLGRGLVEALESSQEALLNSESVALSAQDLARLVPEEQRRFIGEGGGRYVLSLTLEPAADGGIRVTVTPTIIATVGGGEGPLGGRPLASNGTLESAILEALSARLGR